MAGYDAYVAEMEKLKRLTADGVEYWRARDLQGPLGYDQWRNFESAVLRARASCDSSDLKVAHHFAETGNVITAGKGAQLERADWFLTRQACYLLAMNADPAKPEVGYAQTYFTIQTRRQELQDQLTEVERRRELRGRVKDANKGLSSTAKDAGVQRFAIFHNEGYKGLYGMGLSQVKDTKGIGPKEDLLDRAGHAELAANYFRITQTEQRLQRDSVQNEDTANRAHYEVGKKVRDTMRTISGTVPENLPPEPSLKKLGTKRGQKQIGQ